LSVGACSSEQNPPVQGSGAAAGSLQVLGDNAGFGLGLPDISDEGSVSAGSIMLCAAAGNAPLTVTGVDFAANEGIDVQDYRLRPNPFDSPGASTSASPETLGARKGTLDDAAFTGGREVTSTCGESSMELGLQLARAGVALAQASDLRVHYLEDDGAQGILLVRMSVKVCAPEVAATDCEA